MPKLFWIPEEQILEAHLWLGSGKLSWQCHYSVLSLCYCMNFIFKCCYCYTMLIDARWCISLESWGKFLHVQLEMTKVVHLRKSCRTWRRRLKEKSNLLRMASWLEDMELWGTSFRKKSAAERRGWTRAKMCNACACVVQPCRIYCECLLFVGFERLLFLRSRQSQVLPVQCQRWSQPPSTWWHLHLFGLIVCLTRIALTSYLRCVWLSYSSKFIPLKQNDEINSKLVWTGALGQLLHRRAGWSESVDNSKGLQGVSLTNFKKVFQVMADHDALCMSQTWL